MVCRILGNFRVVHDGRRTLCPCVRASVRARVRVRAPVRVRLRRHPRAGGDPEACNHDEQMIPCFRRSAQSTSRQYVCQRVVILDPRLRGDDAGRRHAPPLPLYPQKESPIPVCTERAPCGGGHMWRVAFSRSWKEGGFEARPSTRHLSSLSPHSSQFRGGRFHIESDLFGPEVSRGSIGPQNVSAAGPPGACVTEHIGDDHSRVSEPTWRRCVL